MTICARKKKTNSFSPGSSAAGCEDDLQRCKGRKIGVALPTGTTLSPGAILYVGADWYLKIEGAVESVLEIFPSGYNEAVKIAFEIGNRHFPLALEESKILVPDDKVMIRLMERLGAPWERRQAIFDPIGNTPLHQHESIS